MQGQTLPEDKEIQDHRELSIKVTSRYVQYDRQLNIDIMWPRLRSIKFDHKGYQSKIRKIDNGYGRHARKTKQMCTQRYKVGLDKGDILTKRTLTEYDGIVQQQIDIGCCSRGVSLFYRGHAKDANQFQHLHIKIRGQ